MTSINQELEQVLQPTPSFKKAIGRVILSIISFVFIYAVLLSLAGLVLGGSCWLAFFIITARISFITLAIGLGLVALGVMIFVFMIKFLFVSNNEEKPQRTEIKPTDHPQLFSFLQELTQTTGAPFPKKVYLSPEVNAMVFYNSSFWSMFLPTRKNLEIGLGLVNALNVSEFRAVLAHEFGHFSQRSMKAGSYVYTVNKALYNLVYTHDAWDRTLETWGESGGVFGFFAGLTFQLVTGTRRLLAWAYTFINKSYLRLSREMEYQADLVAVSVSGNTATKQALRKIELAQGGYQFSVSHLDILAGSQQKVPNLFHAHQISIYEVAKSNGVSYEYGSEVIDDDDLSLIQLKSNLVIEDQWASHPTLAEREANIDRIQVQMESNSQSAWSLFSNPEVLQRTVTDAEYQRVYPDKELTEISTDNFLKYLTETKGKYQIDEVYGDLYSTPYLKSFDKESSLKQGSDGLSFEDLFSQKHKQLIRDHQMHINDLETLKAIARKDISVKFFEYEGEKMPRIRVHKLVETLSQRVMDEEAEIKAILQQGFSFFRSAADSEEKREGLDEHYRRHVHSLQERGELEEIWHRLEVKVGELYMRRQTEKSLTILAHDLENLEKRFREFLAGLNHEEVLTEVLMAEDQQLITKYWNSERGVLSKTNFRGEDVSVLIQVFNVLNYAIGNRVSRTGKELTDYQLTLIR